MISLKQFESQILSAFTLPKKKSAAYVTLLQARNRLRKAERIRKAKEQAKADKEKRIADYTAQAETESELVSNSVDNYKQFKAQLLFAYKFGLITADDFK